MDEWPLWTGRLRSGPLLRTAEKSPKDGSGPHWEQLVFRGTWRDVSIPTSSVQTDACLPAPEQGGKSGSFSVYPAEKKVSPGGDHVLAEWGIRQPR